MATDLITRIVLHLKTQLGILNKIIVSPEREKKEEDPLLHVLSLYSPASPKELRICPIAPPSYETQQPKHCLHCTCCTTA